MRRRRAKEKSGVEIVRPELLDPPIRPDELIRRYGEPITYSIDADGNLIYD